MTTLWQDVRYGVRMLLKNPGFTFVAVVALALGIGANASIFSVVNAVLLRPLPFAEAEQLVMVWERRPRQNRESGPVAPADFLDWQKQNQSFAAMAAYSARAFNLTGGGAEPEQLIGQLVTNEFFRVLGARAALGRTLLPEVDLPGGNRVAVISHGLWQRRFGGDAGVVGRTLTLDDEIFTVAGVMPPDFNYPDRETELWASPQRTVPDVILPGNPDPATLRSLHYLNVIARLKPDVTRTAAQAEMETIAGRLEQQYPDANTGHTARVVGLHEQLVGDVRPVLIVLLSAVGFVLLIACANVANLLLARGAGREREMSIRTALGAGRLRLIRQLLTESVLLAVTGGALGLLLALWGTDALVAISPESFPRLQEINLDGRVIGFTFLTSLLTGVIFGLVPALQVSKLDLSSALKDGGRGSAEGFGRRRLRGALIVAEVALTMVLLVGAGLMIRSFDRLLRVDPGFKADHLLTMEVSLPQAKYDESEEQTANFFREIIGRIGELPGVQSAGATWILPLSGQGAGSGFEIEGRDPATVSERLNSAFSSVSPNYFHTMSIPIVKGREFGDRDTATAPGVSLVNETFARRYFPNEDPLGKRIKRRGDDNDWTTIVGVVGDVRQLGLDMEPRAEMFFSYQQSPVPFMNIAVRTATDPATLATAVRQEVWAVNPNQPVANVSTMNELLANSAARTRFNTLLLSLFALIALTLASVGIFGVMSYTVTQRTREIGVRMALGAQRSDVLRLVIRQGMILAGLGIVIGLAAALALTRLMTSLLYGVSATDPATFTGIALLLAGVALVACYIPARRATKVDPMVALRYE
ncbi:MAG: ABC transporter permease [Acidobacteriota bacterium]|nr:ABC transporter permease [Acidobacteriota bacterium]